MFVVMIIMSIYIDVEGTFSFVISDSSWLTWALRGPNDFYFRIAYCFSLRIYYYFFVLYPYRNDYSSLHYALYLQYTTICTFRTMPTAAQVSIVAI